MGVTFEVLHTQWAAEDEVFAGGVHEVAKPTAAFMRLLGSAHMSGSVLIAEADLAEHEKKLFGHIESQETSEAAYAAAQKDGRWQEGNLEQFDLDVASGARNEALEPSEVTS